MGEKRLRMLRERAYEAGILGSSKMDEHELLDALARVGRERRQRSVWGSRLIRRAERRA